MPQQNENVPRHPYHLDGLLCSFHSNYALVACFVGDMHAIVLLFTVCMWVCICVSVVVGRPGGKSAIDRDGDSRRAGWIAFVVMAERLVLGDCMCLSAPISTPFCWLCPNSEFLRFILQRSAIIPVCCVLSKCDYGVCCLCTYSWLCVSVLWLREINDLRMQFFYSYFG